MRQAASYIGRDRKKPLRQWDAIGAKLYSFYNLNPVYHCMAKISSKMRAKRLLYHLIKVLALGQGCPEKEKNMPYVERITRAGKTIEIERYFTSRYKKPGIRRGDKVKPTTEQQEKINTRQAERKLRILINANYGYGDYHLVLDYIRKKGAPERTKGQMRKDIDRFLRECRKEYRKSGLELKYIHVMEIGKKGARHHHLVINRVDTKILQRCWYKAYEGHNRVKVFPLDDSGNYAELASYLIKYTGMGRCKASAGTVART